MSRRTQQRVKGVALLLVAVLACLVCVPRVACAEGQTTTTVRVRVFQEYKVPVSGLQNAFEYTIVPQEEDAPMPVDESGEVIDKFVLRRDEDLWLEFPVEATTDPSATPYAYHYMLTPAQRDLPDGLRYVDLMSTGLEPGINEYALEIHVQPANNDASAPLVVPTVHVSMWDGPKTTDPGWRVGYEEPVEGQEEGGEDSNKKDGENGSGTPRSPAPSSPSASAGGSANPARAQLATTGDTLVPQGMLLCAALAGVLLVVPALRRRAGERNA